MENQNRFVFHIFRTNPSSYSRWWNFKEFNWLNISSTTHCTNLYLNITIHKPLNRWNCINFLNSIFMLKRIFWVIPSPFINYFSEKLTHSDSGFNIIKIITSPMYLSALNSVLFPFLIFSQNNEGNCSSITTNFGNIPPILFIQLNASTYSKTLNEEFR